MTFIEFVSEYWYLLIILCIVVFVIGYSFCYFLFCTPKEKQIKDLQQWLLYAVTIAEKKLKSGTGQIKLRLVYNMFIEKFPYLVKIISFDKISSMVDIALEEFNKMLKSNKKLYDYVYNDLDEEKSNEE